MAKKCKVCNHPIAGIAYDIFKEKSYIDEDCLLDSDDYGECIQCKKMGRKIAYPICDLHRNDDNDCLYCDEHWDGGSPLSEDEESLVEYFSKGD